MSEPAATRGRVARRLRRPVGFESFADLTDVPVKAIGRGHDGETVVEFAAPVAPVVAQAVADRMGTRDDAELGLRRQARQALADNRAWLADMLPQIESGAADIIAHSSSSAQDKGLARGTRSVAGQVAALTRQMNVLIRLVGEIEEP